MSRGPIEQFLPAIREAHADGDHDEVPRQYCPDCADEFRAGRRCMDCGMLGETTGHMECQYPKDRP